ncbi:MAG: T9SS type A sorting domain-containing protein, partial [Candidatus Kapabacteria bacterium]|nr:T9SS type A sorting domain-containing protein [Candidatus Kapabacteria bacterium]
EYIKTLQCLDSNNCYAFTNDVLGRANRVYKSTDQGNSWNAIYEDYYDKLIKISRCFVFDTSKIYLTYSDNYFVDVSTNGCLTFKRTNLERNGETYNGSIYGITMYNQNIGCVVSYDNLFYTKDGWETFKALEQGEYDKIGSPMFFIDSNNVILKKEYRIEDAFVKFNIQTETWTAYNEPWEIPTDEEAKTIYDVCFINDILGFACGGQRYGKGQVTSDIIWKTTNQGKHWEIIHEKLIEDTFPPTKISFSDEKHGMAVGNWGKIIETTDGGETWFYHTNLPEDLVETISVRVAMAGQTPIVSSIAGGIYRYEEPVSVNESEFQDAIFDINQTPENFTINITDDRHRKYKLQIVDISGKTVFEGSLLYSLENVVSLSDFSSGVYVYRILSGGVLARSGKILK